MQAQSQQLAVGRLDAAPSADHDLQNLASMMNSLKISDRLRPSWLVIFSDRLRPSWSAERPEIFPQKSPEINPPMQEPEINEPLRRQAPEIAPEPSPDATPPQPDRSPEIAPHEPHIQPMREPLPTPVHPET